MEKTTERVCMCICKINAAGMGNGGKRIQMYWGQPYVPTAQWSHSPMFPQPNIPTVPDIKEQRVYCYLVKCDDLLKM